MDQMLWTSCIFTHAAILLKVWFVNRKHSWHHSSHCRTSPVVKIVCRVFRVTCLAKRISMQYSSIRLTSNRRNTGFGRWCAEHSCISNSLAWELVGTSLTRPRPAQLWIRLTELTVLILFFAFPRFVPSLKSYTISSHYRLHVSREDFASRAKQNPRWLDWDMCKMWRSAPYNPMQRGTNSILWVNAVVILCDVIHSFLLRCTIYSRLTRQISCTAVTVSKYRFLMFAAIGMFSLW